MSARNRARRLERRRQEAAKPNAGKPSREQREAAVEAQKRQADLLLMLRALQATADVQVFEAV